MIENILSQLQKDFDDSLSHLKSEYSRLQIGRASPALVETITVEAYGTKQPMKALASISIPDSKTVQIQPWDKGVLAAIEKAIQASDLNISPLNDGLSIRLNLPQLTEERRHDIAKIVHKMAEESRISVRHLRQKALDKAKELEKKADITEDQLRSFEKKLQEKVDNVNHLIEELSKAKEKEIMTV
jgi:ribosome recycling factor